MFRTLFYQHGRLNILRGLVLLLVLFAWCGFGAMLLGKAWAWALR